MNQVVLMGVPCSSSLLNEAHAFHACILLSLYLPESDGQVWFLLISFFLRN
jgi:hypothetical protein